jgi:hypothetical protein
VKDWRQEISNAMRDACDHDPDRSVLVGPGCPRCQVTYRKILTVMDEAIEELRGDLRGGSPFQLAMDRFRRSIPSG